MSLTPLLKLGTSCPESALIGRSTLFYRLLVNPFEVEENLKEHPAVRDCAVVSSPHQNREVDACFLGDSNTHTFTISANTFRLRDCCF